MCAQNLQCATLAVLSSAESACSPVKPEMDKTGWRGLRSRKLVGSYLGQKQVCMLQTALSALLCSGSTSLAQRLALSCNGLLHLGKDVGCLVGLALAAALARYPVHSPKMCRGCCSLLAYVTFCHKPAHLMSAVFERLTRASKQIECGTGLGSCACSCCTAGVNTRTNISFE